MPFSPGDTLVSGLCRVAGLPFRLATRDMELFPPEKLLIIKLCCIGDVLQATPVAVALQRAFPAIRIDWAVGDWSRAMIAGNPRVGKILNVGALDGGRLGLGALSKLVRQVREEGYDTCLVLDRSPLAAMVPWLAQVPQRIGLDSSGRGFCHHVRVPVTGVRNEAEVYLDVVRAIGVGAQGARTEFYPTERDEESADELLEKQLKWHGSQPLFIFHPAGGRNPGMRMVSKRWPPERYALLANRLLKECGGKLILLGGPQDRVLLEAVKGLMAYDALVLAGEISWGVWGALLQQATLCVGNDTGATHLGVAVGCKTVFIFGPSDPRRYGPYARPGRAAALWHPITGMVGGVNKGPPRGWTWEEGVSADEAWHAARTLLEDAQPQVSDEEE